ncbi:MAG TPA: hypothetical protein VIF62_07915 [Labilithrix sp.]
MTTEHDADLLPVRYCFDDEEPAPMPLELDTADRPLPSATCARCGAPTEVERETCVYCTQPTPQRFVASSRPPLPVAQAVESKPVTRADRVLDAIAELPYDFWKRVAFYPFLAMLLGNGCTCRGLSFGTNVSLVALAIVGIVGVVASVRAQSVAR